jgi:flagellar FliL protein
MSAQIPSENRSKESQENPPAPSENGGKKPGKKWVWLVLLPLILAGAGGASWYFLFNKETDKSMEHEPSPPAMPPIFVELEAFTVNLPPDGEFLQATFTLQVSDNDDTENLTLYMPQVRSRMLLLLSNKTADNLLLLEGKTLLTQEIMTLLKQPLEKGLKQIKVTNVFITSFVIQ